jgi:hypothetical protein
LHNPTLLMPGSLPTSRMSVLPETADVTRPPNDSTSARAFAEGCHSRGMSDSFTWTLLNWDLACKRTNVKSAASPYLGLTEVQPHAPAQLGENARDVAVQVDPLAQANFEKPQATGRLDSEEEQCTVYTKGKQSDEQPCTV